MSRLREFVDDVVDEEIAAMRVRVAAGDGLTSEEAIHVLDRLIKDRAEKRAYTQRRGSTIQ